MGALRNSDFRQSSNLWKTPLKNKEICVNLLPVELKKSSELTPVATPSRNST
jgi:hypothetical protein